MTAPGFGNCWPEGRGEGLAGGEGLLRAAEVGAGDSLGAVDREARRRRSRDAL